MEYSDWVESTKSKRVWLEDSMTALCQFAYVNPIHKVMHWDAENKRRTNCLKGKYEHCATCDKGVSIIHDYTYGIYTGDSKEIKYLSTALSTHTNFQHRFRENLKENVNPCDLLFQVRKGKITTPKGYETVGYEVEIVKDMEAFVAEKDRPSPFQELSGRFQMHRDGGRLTGNQPVTLGSKQSRSPQDSSNSIEMTILSNLFKK